MKNRDRTTIRDQKGYMLLSVMLLVTVMLIALAAEAPRIAQQIKRSKEDEMVHRGTQYAIAIKKYFHKIHNYPTSLDQLEDTNHVRFLRKKYTDPMTGEANWRVVHAGEAEIPMPQNNNPGLQSSNNPGLQGGNSGQSGGTQQNQQTGQKGAGAGNVPPGGGQQFGGGSIIGVASVSKGSGIKEFNGKSDYADWLFVYDPRLEQAMSVAGAAGGSATAGIAIASPRAGGGSGATPSASPSPSPTPASNSLPR